jgi:hypothetical protein
MELKVARTYGAAGDSWPHRGRENELVCTLRPLLYRQPSDVEVHSPPHMCRWMVK